MARDNGRRGCYRHSGATEQEAQQQQQQPHTPEKSNTSLLDEQNSTGQSPDAHDRAAQRVDETLDRINARFPPLPVPSSLFGRPGDSLFSSGGGSFGGGSFSGQQGEACDGKAGLGPFVAMVIYGSAVVGFGIIMCDGARAIGGFLVEAGDKLMNDLMYFLST